jgi:hypothetical protein
VPYHLPEVLEAIANEQPVFIVEGEKDVESLAKLGSAATCNAGGAGKWKPKHSEYLRDADVVIIPDNDKSGRDHAQQVASSLTAIAKRIRIVELPGLADKGDVSDWISAGGTAEQLWALVEQAPDWKPTKTAAEAGSRRDLTQADHLIEIGSSPDVALYHDQDGTAFADVPVGQHRETWRVGSTGHRRWLCHEYYKATQGAPNREALSTALDAIAARAHFDGIEQAVHIRIARHGGCIYLDLGDAAWRVIVIGADGWRLVHDAPVRFRRTPGMLALPEPQRGGSLEELKDYLPARGDAYVLTVTWVLMALRGDGP